MMIARAKTPCDMRFYGYGEFNGVTFDVEVTPDQKWKVRTAEGYFHLARKGGMKLRLTPAAFHRLFELMEEGE